MLNSRRRLADSLLGDGEKQRVLDDDAPRVRAGGKSRIFAYVPRKHHRICRVRQRCGVPWQRVPFGVYVFDHRLPLRI